MGRLSGRYPGFTHEPGKVSATCSVQSHVSTLSRYLDIYNLLSTFWMTRGYRDPLPSQDTQRARGHCPHTLHTPTLCHATPPAAPRHLYKHYWSPRNTLKSGVEERIKSEV